MKKSSSPEHWREATLGDVADWYSGGTPRTSEPSFWGGDIPWITSGSLTSFRLRDSVRRLTPAGLASGSRLVPKDSVLFVVRGMSLKSEFRMGIADRPLAFGQDCKALIARVGVDPLYLAYAIKARTADILNLVDEAGHGTGRLNTDQMKALTVLVAPPDEQQKITTILRALDDKIELNSEKSKTIDQLLPLELEAARSGRPAGVRTPLGAIAKLRKGVSYRSVELAPSRTAMVSLKCVGRTGEFQPEGLKEYVGTPRADQVVVPGELVVAQTDLTQGAEVVGRVLRVPSFTGYDSLVASLDLVIVRPTPPVQREYLYSVLQGRDFREHCVARTSGTTVLHMATDAVPSFEFALDPPDVRTAFVEVAGPLLSERDRLSSESRLLAELRDALLPELLSGRLRVEPQTDKAEVA